MLSSMISKAAITRSSRYQQAVIQRWHSRGVSTTPLSSATRGHCSNKNFFNNFVLSTILHQPRQSKSHRILLDMALFSSALLLTTSSNNASAASCDKNNSPKSDDDNDFIAKIKAKISAQTITIPFSADDLLATAASQAQLALDSGIPTNLSYGFFAGYLSGFALKKIGKVASLTFGVGFVLLQTLAYQGYIDVNHEELARKVEGVLDRNGDGKVDGEDLRKVLEEVRGVVGFGIEESGEGGGDNGVKEQAKAVAGGGGFGLGFLGGLRSG